jgi:two-component system CheB/CheR fusion protein
MMHSGDKAAQSGLPKGGSGFNHPALEVPEQLPSPDDTPNKEAGFAIVAIGASAGGLEACTRFVSALPPVTGMAFILVQHLDPTHESLMTSLLATHTVLKVQEATDGQSITPEHLYVIPPGTYLGIADGVLQLSEKSAQHGARLPFDFLLKSLSRVCAARTACVILSGTGADGSIGLQNIKQHGGLIVAQSPDEAEFDGMPRTAIETGTVDAVLPVARMPAALAEFAAKLAAPLPPTDATAADPTAIIELLRTRTSYDFRYYKPGTLQRRIDLRIEMAGIPSGDTAQYLNLLQDDETERESLAKDLLINVTRFFRDPKAFDLLEATIIPDLIRDHPGDSAVRIWVPACSSGEEAYSIAMLFVEAIAASKRSLELQVFASDVDPDVIAAAREGYFPETIAADLTAERLNAFFIREEGGYRVTPELRASIVFVVQDVLADPPFSRVDLVSCRNLLIYLKPDAQVKVIALLRFALRPRGILLLGSSETPGDITGRFELGSGLIDRARR